MLQGCRQRRSAFTIIGLWLIFLLATMMDRARAFNVIATITALSSRGVRRMPLPRCIIPSLRHARRPVYPRICAVSTSTTVTDRDSSRTDGGSDNEDEESIKARTESAGQDWRDGQAVGAVEEQQGTAYGQEDIGDDDDERGGVMPTEEELNVMVAQRGSDMVRMNAGASHLALAHTIWGQVLRPGGVVVDATCGNGHDSVELARFLFPSGVSERVWGHLHCIDIQDEAIEATKRQLLVNSGTPLCSGGAPLLNRHVSFHKQNFRTFPEAIELESVNVLVYNLGHLPGRDKGVTTMTPDTIESLKQALFLRQLIAVRGLVSIMCYRGHPEGAKETAAVQAFVEQLDPMVWRTFVHAPLNRPLSPLLITIYRLR